MLDAQLNSYQKDFEQNALAEGNLSVAFETFSNTDLAMGPIIDDWVKAEPDSYPAHMARAKYLVELGWQARGNEYLDKTSDKQLTEMSRLLVEGLKEAAAALKLNPKASQAYALIIQAAKAIYDHKTLEGVYAASLKTVPLSLSTRVSMMTALEPRWGGSHEAMEKFGDEAQKYVAQNPRLRSLKGFADVDRGDIAWEGGDVKAAIRYYNQALEEGGDFALAYSNRGSAYDALRLDADALEDLNRANKLRPQDASTLQMLAFVYVHLDRPNDALHVIQEYQDFALLPPDLVRLQQWAQNFQSGVSQAVKTGGN